MAVDRRHAWLACRLVLAVALGSSPAQAGGVDLGPPPTMAADAGFVVPTAAVRGDRLVATRLLLDVQHRPLVLRNAASELDVVVARQARIHAQASVALRHRFALGVDVPLVLTEPGDPAPSGATAARPEDAGSLGDVRFFARAVVADSSSESLLGTRLALASSVSLPTSRDRFAGDEGLGGASSVVADGLHPRGYWSASGGVRFRPTMSLPGVVPSRVGTALALGAAAGVHPGRDRALAVGFEVAMSSPFVGGARLLDPRAIVAHLLLTGRYRVRGGPLELAFAGGPDLGGGAGAAAFRVMAQVGFVPEREPPPPDADKDGVPDAKDACPRAAGEASRVRAMNGCPEMNDRDGDAIPDEVDACPRVAGEPTFQRETHGCARARDRDGDGVPDRDDACVDVVGEPALRGCPPPAPVRLVDERLELEHQVQFEVDTALLRRESEGLLAEVAKLFREHPELELVEVQGHTDDSGTPEHNQRLSEERAASVVRWLTSHGIEARRLVARGLGQRAPLVAGGDADARRANRRVEFHVLRRGGRP
ncbi:MAG: OmpA family protein [Deltaproteobacteria bacterium]|nr:OmpA family protein [Deltaproteobacteria bacterium]